LVGNPAGAAFGPPDLRELQAETRKLAQLREELDETVIRSTRRVGTLTAQLAEEEQRLHGAAVETEDLRRARLDLESMQSRLAVVGGRIEQYGLRLTRLRQLRDELAISLAAADGLGAEHLRREAGQRLLREQEDALLNTVASYEALAAVGRRQVELLSQRLRLLQSRLSLAAFDRAAVSAADERIPVLQAVIADFMLRATHASRDLDAVVGDTPSAADRRRRLDAQVNEAVTRAFLRQNDLELVLTGNRMEALVALRADDSMPLHVLRAGARNLNEIAATLTRLEDALNAQARGLDSRLDALARQGAETEDQQRAATDLMGLMDFQRQDIQALHDRLQVEQVALAQVIGEASAASLLEHRALPVLAADWSRIATAVVNLPRLAADAGADLWQSLRTQAAADPHRFALLAFGLPLLTVLLLWTARRIAVFAASQAAPGALGRAAEAAARALPAALPAALWGLTGWLLGVRRELVLPLLVLLALVPAVVFLLRLARWLAVPPAPAASQTGLEAAADLQDAGTSAAAGEPRRETEQEPAPALIADAPGRRLLRHLRFAVAVAAAVAALHVLTRLLPLPPLLMDLVDRLAMLVFLTLLPPALGIERALREWTRAVPATQPRGLGFMYGLSRLLPGFVLLTGGAGVLGYTNLAWTLMGFSLWLTLVALGLYISVGLLQALSARLDGHLRNADAENADFWRTHFIEPGRRLTQLGLYLGAGWLLLWLWGWDAQTPPVRWLLTLVRTELFQLGATPFTAGDILLTLLLIGAALWVGGWSQQVSYRLAYQRVRDVGLRQALATFTRYLVVVAGVLLALSIIGFDLTALTVFAASLGVGIGFGLQNIVNNFISGILLLAERPLRIGDYVSIGANDGTVTQIGIRSLTVRTPDRQEVVIPNGSVISSEFTNWTREDDTVRQVHYLVIRYESDRERAMALIREVLDNDPSVLKDPAPGVYLWEYTERGVRLRVQFCFRFVHGPGSFATRSAVLLEIGRRFAEAGIEFAEVGLLQRLAAASLDGAA
jgi:potassium efflux system protein